MFKIFEALGVLSTYKLNKQCAIILYAHASSSPNPPPSVGKLVQYIYFNNSVGKAIPMTVVVMILCFGKVASADMT